MPKTGRTRPPKPTARSKAKGAQKLLSGARARYRRPIPVDTSAEEAAAYERHHAAELEEEGRRHASAESEERTLRDDRALEEERVSAIDPDAERRENRDGAAEDDPEEPSTDDGQAEGDETTASDPGEGGTPNSYYTDAMIDRLGDLTLSDPDEMQRTLGPSVRFAQHAMLLAEDHFAATGDRHGAIEHLAALYTGCQDRAYANKALRDFGHATGILSLYPLELVDHLLRFAPGFCARIEHRRLLETLERPGEAKADTSGETERRFEMETGHFAVFFLPDGLRLRGFALRDGARPGYIVEPDEGGGFRMRFDAPGQFGVLLSAIDRERNLWLDEVVVHVRGERPEGERARRAPASIEVAANGSEPPDTSKA